jgi:plasmid stability protein
MEPNGGVMVTLTIKNVPEELYERIKTQAKNNHRSINKEVITIIERAFTIPPIDVQATLERTRKIRELTAHYIITDEEMTTWKKEGRK